MARGGKKEQLPWFCSDVDDLYKLPLKDRKQEAELWFSDENAIIIATAELLFRVNPNILVKYSPVFRDTFALSRDSNRLETETETENTYQGTPVIYMPDDSSSMSWFLLTLYRRECVLSFFPLLFLMPNSH